MKKRFVVTLLALVMIAFLMVSCVQKGPEAPAAPDAATFVATPGIGVVELNWGEVPGATFYDIVINLVQPAGERAEQTQWTVRVAAPPYSFVVEVAGTYSWTVAAGNNAGTSDPVAGGNFTGTPVAEEPTYDTPTVEITSPAEGANTTLTPTIEWTAVPGTVTETEARGYAIDSCEVVIKEGTTEIATGAGVQGVGNAWSYDVPADTLVFGKAYTVEVTASQEGAENDGVDTVNFNTPAELELELSATTTYECDTIIATVTANNTDINKVAIFGKLPADVDFQKLAPAGENWREPDAVTRNAVFTLSATELGAGVWTINAQALGNAAESQDETLTIQEIMPTVSMSLQVCEKDVLNGQYVCYDPEAAELPEAVYSIEVTVPDEMVSFIEEYYYSFQFAGASGESGSGYATDTESVSTDITVELATECTKLATVTIFGTTTCASTFTDVATMMFVLDGSAPTLTVSEPQLDAATETATITFAASDTKSLCAATMTIMIEKVDENGDQMDGWEIAFPWMSTSFENENFGGSATYSAAIGKGEATNAVATVTLDLPKLDGATITTTFEVIDCCEVLCCDICGDPITNNSVSGTGTPVFFDNWYYDAGIVNVSFFDADDFADLGDAWLIAMENNPASMTLWAEDAYYFDMDGTLTGDLSTIESSSLTSPVSTYVSAPCTGYPTKTFISADYILTAKEATEGSIEVTFYATDTSGNATVLTQEILVDTLQPTLTVVKGLKNEGYGREALQFSFRDADSDQNITCLGATVTVHGFLPEYYDNASGDVIVRVDESDSKTWIIDPLSKNGALDPEGTVTLEVRAKDGYGNEGVSTMVGGVIPYAPER